MSVEGAWQYADHAKEVRVMGGEGCNWLSEPYPVWVEDLEKGDVWMDLCGHACVVEYADRKPDGKGQLRLKVGRTRQPTRWVKRSHDELCYLLGSTLGFYKEDI